MKPISQFSRRILGLTNKFGVFLGNLDKSKCQWKVSIQKICT